MAADFLNSAFNILVMIAREELGDLEMRNMTKPLVGLCIFACVYKREYSLDPLCVKEIDCEFAMRVNKFLQEHIDEKVP